MAVDTTVQPPATSPPTALAPATAAQVKPAPPRPGAAAMLVSLLPAAAACTALVAHWHIPSTQTSLPTDLYPKLLQGVIAIALAIFAAQYLWPALRRWARPRAPIVTAALLTLMTWDLVTLKYALMPLPYFPGPDMVMQSLWDDWELLARCTFHSLILLASGYALGAAMGIVSGVLIGWFAACRYWGMPLLKLVGPIPATAFIPLAMMVFPSAFTASVALIAIAVWFPVTMLTISGIANVRVSLLDVARTLGAGPSFLVFRVAVPAALPSIFIGLFMGLGASFLTLIVAETVGVKAGLGWYVGWAKVWADYAKVYAALIIMALFFSCIMTLLFMLRDRVLVYQKGVIKW